MSPLGMLKNFSVASSIELGALSDSGPIPSCLHLFSNKASIELVTFLLKQQQD